ncbi:Glycosyltransferase [Thermodesulfovibrio sp. N1]|uniref:glycosyltransferase family 4 protein n=1 Tax=Thermodesulfovibrio sp. N1 TaxID=1871110 RepID=UPI00083B67D9|nr:glycosyltransferase family 4 protein [Thermodesulfovibrio sp. N1]ODA44546.1 Glycosyltransferase [Thermodesulfovibrio sp. N1]
MKILHLIYDHINNPWVGGGGAVRVYEIYKRLAPKGYDITVVSGKYPGARDYEENSIKFNFIGSRQSYIISVFSYAFNVIKFLRTNAKEFDIIIEDFAPWNPLFAKFFHKITVLQVHHKEGFNILKKYLLAGLPFYLIEKFYPKIYSHVIVVSEKTRDKFKLKGKVIANGISEHLLFKETRIGDYIAFIGRIDIYNKGLDLLLKACEKLDIQLKLAGKGKDFKKLIYLIEKFNLSDRVSYLGFLSENDKTLFIANSRFLIMPSRFEGQGIVALEAAAMGKPLIVSDIPELSYVTENGFGISFRSGDTNSLRKAIEYLWNNEKLILQMGEKGRQFAKQFTWDRIAEEYENYINEILDLL